MCFTSSGERSRTLSLYPLARTVICVSVPAVTSSTRNVPLLPLSTRLCAVPDSTKTSASSTADLPCPSTFPQSSPASPPHRAIPLTFLPATSTGGGEETGVWLGTSWIGVVARLRRLAHSPHRFR